MRWTWVILRGDKPYVVYAVSALQTQADTLKFCKPRIAAEWVTWNSVLLDYELVGRGVRTSFEGRGSLFSSSNRLEK